MKVQLFFKATWKMNLKTGDIINDLCCIRLTPDLERL